MEYLNPLAIIVCIVATIANIFISFGGRREKEGKLEQRVEDAEATVNRMKKKCESHDSCIKTVEIQQGRHDEKLKDHDRRLEHLEGK
ncbi:MAG: hypothetical protein PHE15_04990 [Dehalococcoidales bacterium]|nr:hypothetical protein [Dehalococcoidales bacterium]